MTTRTFTRDQLAAMGVPDDWDAEDGQQADHLHERQVGSRRWVSVHELVFRAPDDGLAYSVHYERGLTEHQDGLDAWGYADEIQATVVEQRPVVIEKWLPVDAPADRSLDAVLPAWEAMYEPGNVSDYLIGYANSEAGAKGAAEAWLRSESEVIGRLEWLPQNPSDGYDTEFELIERHDDGVDTGPGVTVRRRTQAVQQ
ncbi:hypothetical protein [Streptomyces luteocolor]|uniref:hypothetical protein n=1 Tax=Streptomyces luteocolor TaxID=285500 RepID=UPI0008532EE9|nr:hypothetical protein [Streptomyces luteocolor]